MSSTTYQITRTKYWLPSTFQRPNNRMWHQMSSTKYWLPSTFQRLNSRVWLWETKCQVLSAKLQVLKYCVPSTFQRRGKRVWHQMSSTKYQISSTKYWLPSTFQRRGSRVWHQVTKCLLPFQSKETLRAAANGGGKKICIKWILENIARWKDNSWTAGGGLEIKSGTWKTLPFFVCLPMTPEHWRLASLQSKSFSPHMELDKQPTTLKSRINISSTPGRFYNSRILNF